MARLTESHNHALKAERSPITKLILLNAYIRQFITKVRDALKSRPADGSRVVQVLSKIQARAIQICEYLKTTIQDDPLR
jgi:hypothetical protein